MTNTVKFHPLLSLFIPCNPSANLHLVYCICIQLLHSISHTSSIHFIRYILSAALHILRSIHYAAPNPSIPFLSSQLTTLHPLQSFHNTLSATIYPLPFHPLLPIHYTPSATLHPLNYICTLVAEILQDQIKPSLFLGQISLSQCPLSKGGNGGENN